MKIKLSKTSILTEAEISANIQQLINSGDYENAYKQASTEVNDTNEKLFELRMTYSPNDKKKTNSAASLQAFTSKYLVMKDENGRPISTRTRNTPGGDSVVGKVLSKLFGYGKIDKDNFSEYFTISDNEDDAFISTEANINQIIKQLEKGFGKDIQLVKLQARPGEVSNEKDEVIDKFLESVNIDKDKIKNFRSTFIKDCESLGFDQTKNPIIFWVQEFAQNLNLTNDKYSVIHNLWANNVITSDDLKNKDNDSIVFNKSLYSNTWVNIEWIVQAYKDAFSDLDLNTLIDPTSPEGKPQLYKGTPSQFKNQAFFGKPEANPVTDVLQSRKDIAEFSSKYISEEGLTKANSKVTPKKAKTEVEDNTTSNETPKAKPEPKPIKDAKRWEKVLQDTNNQNLSKQEITDFKRYLDNVSKK